MDQRLNDNNSFWLNLKKVIGKFESYFYFKFMYMRVKLTRDEEKDNSALAISALRFKRYYKIWIWTSLIRLLTLNMFQEVLTILVDTF